MNMPEFNNEASKKEVYYSLMEAMKQCGEKSDNPFERMMNMKERIEKALEHAKRYNQLNDALWPNMPFSLTIGELLNLALQALEKEKH